MAKEIVTNDDLRSTLILLDAAAKTMCNEKTQEGVNKQFAEAKDLLIALYRYNSSRTTTKN